jgi:FkbM family methyltransferase
VAEGVALLDKHTPWSGPTVTSYAQVAEDLRLWRALSGTADRFYVDVGAGHPVVDSVTKLFYDAGWCGINVEPGPNFALLACARPRDVNLELAIASEPGARELWISSPDPGLSSLRRPEEAHPEGFTFRPKTVRVARLDEVLDRHARGRTIDFLKIDVEGAEREVLASFDPSAARARIIVVEAISPLTHRPRHAEWEPLLLDAGYLHATFDGINRFYVSPEHAELIDVLAYPISPLDRYVQQATLCLSASVAELTQEVERLRDPDHPPTSGREAEALMDAMKRSFSWRVTRPLRAARGAQKRIFFGHRTPQLAADEADTLGRAFATRVEQAAALTAPDSAGPGTAHGLTIDEALERLAASIAISPISAEEIAWLCLVAVTGSYPDERDTLRLAELLRRSGAEAVTQSLKDRFDEFKASGSATTSVLDVVRDTVVVDATLVLTSDLQRGIHRVAREAVCRWMEADPSLCLTFFDEGRAALKRVSSAEIERVRTWRQQAGVADMPLASRRPEEGSGDTLVPWHCHLVVAELLAPRHARAIASLRRSCIGTLGVVCFDLIPLVAPELVPRGLSVAFLDYLSVLKQADRVSTISHQTAADLHAFATMLRGEGRAGPEIAAHPLPTVPPSGPADRLTRATRDARGKPLVVVVGPHETRKNHVAVLEAAERLWRSELDFDLVFLGAVAFDSELGFDAVVTHLIDAGRSVRVTGPAAEAELWSAYRAARFSVFPSLIEGFGLPVAESLASGTPVITSNYGSMAEIAEGGGALLVDPRDVDDLEERMRQLLTDDELYERLRREALARDFGSWDDYARDVWDFFTRDPAAPRH